MIKYGNKKIFLLGAFLVFLIDQMTKTWAYKFLPFDKEHVMNHLFSLHLIYNESYIMMNYNVLDSKSFLESTNQFNIAYTFVCFILCAAIVWVTRQPALNEEKWSAEFAKTGLFFICGGILGNAFDRVFRANGVIDFVRVKDGDNYDFIFNFADLAVFMGEFCLAVAWLLIILSFISNKFNIFSFEKKPSLD
jgi:lipoprotein signal peptidase